MRKIVYSGNLEPYRPVMEEKLSGWEITEAKSQESLKEHLADAEILLGWGGTREALQNAKKLRWIQTFSAGVDSMPFELLRECGIILTTASGVHANPISETIFGMMLGFSRALFRLRDNQAENKWGGDIGAMTEIHGKTMGIIGAGSIGAETARLAKSFNMHVLGFRRTGGALEGFDEMYGPGGLRNMLARCDYIVNILPATKNTIGIVGAAEFKAMKNTSVYITVGRGKTTDTNALIQALEKREIAAAGLDVTDPEPLPPDSPLWRMKNVIIGSHRAGGTDSYMERVMEIFLSNLEDYLSGQTPSRNLVDLDLQY